MARQGFLYLALSMLAACAIVDNPNLSDVDKSLLEEAKTSHKIGNYAKEEEIYRQLLAEYPNNSDFSFHYAEAARLVGDEKTALEYYDKVLKAEPESIDAEEGKGLALMMAGRLDEAAKIFSDIIQKDAARWKTINALGVISALQGRIDQAMEYYDMALTITPDNPNILNNMGLSYALDGDYQNAVRALIHGAAGAGADNFKKRKIDLNLSMVYGLMGKVPEAEKILRGYLPDDKVKEYLALYAKLRSDRKAAGSYINKALAPTPAAPFQWKR